MKYKFHPNEWLEHGHKKDDDWSIKVLRLISESDLTGSARFDVKEAPIWDFVEVDKYICPILHNQINLDNNILYTLIDYGNKFIENITTKNKLLVIH